MRDTYARAEKIVSTLSTDDKIRLVSGRDAWTTEPVDEHGVPSIMLTDGPHGVRKQVVATDHIGINNAAPATCFPTAVTLGSTWDPELIEEVGAALGRESRANDVAVLLGPGLNIKRHPAGGRNFEYFSEDPFLSGKMAAAMVRGIQSQGVGACLKHYAANNQEFFRMSIDTVVDDRTLRELYLTGFEIAVKESQPWTVMCSYNKVNGEHADISRTLLTDILRDEWGFDGLVMSDWHAVSDRALGICAGLDLEMPGSDGSWDSQVDAAHNSGLLTTAELDLAVTRVIDLALRTQNDKGSSQVDPAAHHELARRAAAAGTVLLTNDGILPLERTGSIAVIGSFAKKPRYQGAGSSLVTPTQVDTFIEALRASVGDAAEVHYAQGYDAATGETEEALLAEVRDAARKADVVIVLAGLPDSYESEGFDREHLRLPDGHIATIAAATEANHRTVVALLNGAPIEMPWSDGPAAIVEAYLGGQAGGSALADVILGDVAPGGRLAESFPVSASDLPAARDFARHAKQVQYREGLYVGYRFHDAAGVPARFPFGHGLTYTAFDHSGLTVRKTKDGYSVTVTVTNVGPRAGSEVVQVYVRDPESTVYRPEKELKGFAKVHLEPGTSQKVTVRLDRRALAVWDVRSQEWRVETGGYEILVGASSTDIRARRTVTVTEGQAVFPAHGPSAFVATDDEFRTMLGSEIPPVPTAVPFHRDSTTADLHETATGRMFAGMMTQQAGRSYDWDNADASTRRMFETNVRSAPLRQVAMGSEGKMSFASLDRLIRILNLTSAKAWREHG
ncbi:glycoside hydrolase family 3 C-terminal domain-containing protein [Demequina sp. SYSU T00192]|uniref:Glycoside hydrolase family 3 C-terminal domain-containing protein n=1 Tax=Demequina litoralis TaxID=3051660 RepID=A0ABT8GBR6_9MICO|nr:glycoside hydrolase family 3 C-terminal domain-containing protein [Demequina sp. SYSU T00192]MDN4476424.1 glycoside hydrolase family 3 C-terminal domain-containing protein [Demequina sp. SYSU T00192]